MQPTTNRGFTLVELVVVLMIITVLMGILVPVLSRGRDEAKATVCLSNLKQVGGGFHVFATEHNGRLPPDSLDAIWLSLLNDQLPDQKAFICPSDPDAAAIGAGISYGWRDDFAVTDPAASLAGRNLFTVGPPDLIMLFDNIVGWHGKTDVQGADLEASARRYAYSDYQANLLRHVD